MTASELINHLSKVHPDTEIWLSRDPEGNGYAKLEHVQPDAIITDKASYEPTVYDRDWTAEEACMTEDEWADLNCDEVDHVVLWP